MDKKRILSGVIIASVLSVAVCTVPAGNFLVAAGLLVVCALAMREVYALMARGGLAASSTVGMAAGLLFTGATWLVARQGWPGDVLWSLLLLILLLVFFRLFVYPDARQALHNALGTLFGFLYVAFFWSFFVRLYMAGGSYQPGYTAFYLLLTVKFGDTGAYFVGSRFGRRKLFERVSPNKTIEGLLGGILFSCIVSVLWVLGSGGWLGPYALSIPHALLLGVLLAVIGTLGDLVESLFKRAADIKDSGEIAHGMGGMLDMIDSLLFAAPALYVYIHFVLS